MDFSFDSLAHTAIDLVSNSPLKVGNISFSGMEIPERIGFGGTQQLNIKRLIGGKKIVEGTGWTPTNPAWSGRFQGSNATQRARALQAMCEAGLPVDVYYGGMSYTVVIREFLPIYERSYQIPYSITCEVVTDNAGDNDGFLDQSLDELIGADTLDSVGLGNLIGDVTLNEALGTLQTGLNTVGTLTGNPQLGTISSYISKAQNLTSGISNASTGNIQNVVFGGLNFASTIGLNVSKVTDAVSAATTLANSTAATNFLTRAAKNLTGA